MDINLINETSKALQDLYYKYTHLPIGGKEIVCPYWMNNLEKGIYGPVGGKGTPEQIVEAVVKEAESENVDLERMDEESIILFMKAKKIGIDCSGFVFWMLNTLDIEKGGNGIDVDKSRANARMITASEVSFPVEKIEEIKAGDIIRIRRGKHVAIVISLEKDNKGNTRFINYAHSSSNSLTKISGVHCAKIEIINPPKDLREQKWYEETINGLSYGTEIFLQDGDGVKRLKIWG